MTPSTRKGHVEFRQPQAKVVADMPQDAEMREHLDELKQNDGYEGSCAIVKGDENK